MQETIFYLPDIMCDGCADSIRKALSRQPGVAESRVDIPAKSVTVRFNESQADPGELAALLDAIGFPAQPV